MPRHHVLFAVAVILVFSLAAGEANNGIPLLEDLLTYEQLLLRKKREAPRLDHSDGFGSDPFKIHYLPEQEQAADGGDIN